jgi:O-antigen/teichoic acid export membrane protein
MALVPTYGATGAAVAALGGNIAVWVSSFALARYRNVETPPLILASRPLFVAAALAFCTTLVTLPVWAEAAGALLLYVLIAPVVDRWLWSDVRHLAGAGHAAQ